MKKNKQSDKKGFSYTLETDKILEYIKLTTEEKLQWLEAINKLNQAVYSRTDWKVIEKLKGKR